MGAGPGGERAPPARRGQVSWSPAWAGVGPRGAAGFWLWPGPRVWLVPVQPRWLRFTHRFGRAGLGFPVPQVLSLQRGPGQSGSGSGPARKCRLHGLPGARLCPPHRRSGVCGSAVTSAARAAVMRGPHGTVERAPPQRLGLAGRPRVSLLPRPRRPPPWPATWVPPILTRHPREARGIQGVETGLSRAAWLRAHAGGSVCWGPCRPHDLGPPLPPLGGTVPQCARCRAPHAAAPRRLLAVPLSVTPLDPWGN